MTRRNRPDELRDRISQLIRYEQRGLPTAAMARITELDHDKQRATIETVPDGVTENNVPVASPYAADGHGDLAPIDPAVTDGPVRGLALYLHHGVNNQMTGEGFDFGATRGHDESNAVFLPAMLWFDTDEVPDHEPDERRIDQPAGSHVSLSGREARIQHHLGAAVELLGDEPEEEMEAIIEEDRDHVEEWGAEFVDEESDNTSWPIAEDQDESAARISHPDGPAVTTVERGVSLERGDQRVAAGPFNDGDRQPLAGPHQHFHVMHNNDGSKSLVGPQLSFREFIAWMTDSSRQSDLTNADQHADARQFAESYLAWLEDDLGRSIDPTDPHDWPEPEPMPTPAEFDAFGPVTVAVETAGATVSARETSISQE